MPSSSPPATGRLCVAPPRCRSSRHARTAPPPRAPLRARPAERAAGGAAAHAARARRVVGPVEPPALPRREGRPAQPRGASRAIAIAPPFLPLLSVFPPLPLPPHPTHPARGGAPRARWRSTRPSSQRPPASENDGRPAGRAEASAPRAAAVGCDRMGAPAPSRPGRTGRARRPVGVPARTSQRRRRGRAGGTPAWEARGCRAPGRPGLDRRGQRQAAIHTQGRAPGAARAGAARRMCVCTKERNIGFGERCGGGDRGGGEGAARGACAGHAGHLRAQRRGRTAARRPSASTHASASWQPRRLGAPPAPPCLSKPHDSWHAARPPSARRVREQRQWAQGGEAVTSARPWHRPWRPGRALSRRGARRPGRRGAGGAGATGPGGHGRELRPPSRPRRLAARGGVARRPHASPLPPSPGARLRRRP